MEAPSTPLEAGLDLMRRLPPDAVVDNLASVLDLVPELTEELLEKVDQPLQVAVDEVASREFLLCDFNRDADSYRSPWSNTYFPALEDGTTPPEALRALELQANELFAAYRDQYYDSALSSVYLWPRAAAAAEETAAPEPGARDAPFAGCFLIHKGAAGRGGDGGEGSVEEHSSGRWDATHVVSVFPDARAGTTSYELSTTVAVTLSTRSGVDEQEGSVRHDGNVSLAGSLSRSATSVAPTPATAAGHLVALGRMIEDMENRLRTTMDAVYFGKSREVIAHLRKAETQELAVDRRESKQASLLADSLRGVGMGAPGPSGSGAGVKPPPGGIGLPGMMGLGPGFDPKAALANLRATKKAPPPAAE